MLDVIEVEVVLSQAWSRAPPPKCVAWQSCNTNPLSRRSFKAEWLGAVREQMFKSPIINTGPASGIIHFFFTRKSL